MDNTIREIEKKYNVTVLYLSMYGSKLYGTDTAKSDTDYKGIFVSSERDYLLKVDKEIITINTNNNGKNSKDDLDIELYSLHKFMSLLNKGETGAMDLFFSMYSDKVVHQNDEFVKLLKDNKKYLYNNNFDSFYGYAICKPAIDEIILETIYNN